MKGSSILKRARRTRRGGADPLGASQADQGAGGQVAYPGAGEEAAKAAVAGATPLSQNAYKVTLARVAVKRALMQAAGVKG